MLRVTYLSVNLPNLSLNFSAHSDMLTKVTCKSKKKKKNWTTFFSRELTLPTSLQLSELVSKVSYSSCRSLISEAFFFFWDLGHHILARHFCRSHSLASVAAYMMAIIQTQEPQWACFDHILDVRELSNISFYCLLTNMQKENYLAMPDKTGA